MKVFVVLCIVLFAFTLIVSAKKNKSNDEEKAKSYKKVFKECQKKDETRVDASIIRKLKKHKQVDLPANFGEHKLCVFTGIGLLKADNTVDEDKLKKKIASAKPQKDIVDNIVMDCTSSKSTLQETALNLDKCLTTYSIEF
uniref:Odorant binding protein 20 n=1 Tax=Dendroctonus ponderosae TaxID=77166 RepID=A0A0H3W5A6_DENPD|nr:odorant binding protein 20 [Dendroctonus ponderosae]